MIAAYLLRGKADHSIVAAYRQDGVWHAAKSWGPIRKWPYQYIYTFQTRKAALSRFHQLVHKLSGNGFKVVWTSHDHAQGSGVDTQGSWAAAKVSGYLHPGGHLPWWFENAISKADQTVKNWIPRPTTDGIEDPKPSEEVQTDPVPLLARTNAPWKF